MLAHRSGQALTELLLWDPRDIATLTDILEEEDAAARRRARRG